MSGTSSEQPTERPSTGTEAPELPVQRRIRVTNLYATPWHLPDGNADGELPGHLKLWRFKRNYQLSADQLPKVLHRAVLDPGQFGFNRWQDGATVTGTRIWLFHLPSGQIVAAVSLDTSCELADTIDLLEDCYFADITIAGSTVTDHLHTLAVQLGADGTAEPEFLPERHQVVLDKDVATDDCEDLVQRLIYRADLPYRKEHSAIRYPAELNRRPGWLAALGPYVSVVCGHPEFIENAIFISTVQAVAAAAQLRAIRQAAYDDVRLFRSLEATPGSTRDRRRTLERIADQLGDLELELSFSVEATGDLGLLVPSLRVESFHNALYDCMGLAAKAITVEKMMQRLSAAIAAELTAIESIERRADETRRLRYAVAVGFVSVVAIPASLILAFLGINASQVNPHMSMFSHRYLPMYLAVAALLVLGALLSVALWVQHRRDQRHQRITAPRPRWTPAPELSQE